MPERILQDIAQIEPDGERQAREEQHDKRDMQPFIALAGQLLPRPRSSVAFPYLKSP
jgi:hypothetical protein